VWSHTIALIFVGEQHHVLTKAAAQSKFGLKQARQGVSELIQLTGPCAVYYQAGEAYTEDSRITPLGELVMAGTAALQVA